MYSSRKLDPDSVLGFFRLLRRLGRWGGLLALLLGVGPALLALFLWQASLSDGNWSPPEMARSLLLGAIALILAVVGIRQLANPPKVERASRLSGAEFMAQAGQASRPFFACASCRRVFTVVECFGPCLACGSTADCLEIRGDEDLKMLAASVESLEA